MKKEKSCFYRIIRYSILFAISLGFVSISYSQKCKFTSKELLDKRYGGKVISQTVGFNFSSKASKTGMLTFVEFKDVNILRVLVKRIYGRALNYLSSDPMVFHFSDSSEHRLYPNNIYLGLTGVGNALYETNDKIEYSITQEDLKIISNKSISRIEINYSKNENDTKEDNTDV